MHFIARNASTTDAWIEELQVGEGSFRTTSHGAVYHWSLEECLAHPDCPLADGAKKNLLFLTGIRHEIEHQMTARIDGQLSAKFMATALNFNSTIKVHFGNKYALDKDQAFSIQFSAIDTNTSKLLLAESDLPRNIRSYVAQFEREMSQEEYDDPAFSYRVALVQKVSNSKTSADQLYQLVSPGSELAAQINNVLLKETEKKKYKPGTIVDQMNAEGYVNFTMHRHTVLWKAKDAKNPRHQYGTLVEGIWYWYESWLAQVRHYCAEHEVIQKPASPSTASDATQSMVG